MLHKHRHHQLTRKKSVVTRRECVVEFKSCIRLAPLTIMAMFDVCGFMSPPLSCTPPDSHLPSSSFTCSGDCFSLVFELDTPDDDVVGGEDSTIDFTAHCNCDHRTPDLQCAVVDAAQCWWCAACGGCDCCCATVFAFAENEKNGVAAPAGYAVYGCAPIVDGV